MREAKTSLAAVKDSSLVAKVAHDMHFITAHRRTQAAEDQLRLLSVQRQLEQQFRSQFVGLAIYDTIFEARPHGPRWAAQGLQLLAMKQEEVAQKVRKDFKVSDKKCEIGKSQPQSCVQVYVGQDQRAGGGQGLCRAGGVCQEEVADWLCGAGCENETACDYETQPFVERLLAANERFQAKKYIPRVTNPEQKVKFFIELGCVRPGVVLMRGLSGGAEWCPRQLRWPFRSRTTSCWSRSRSPRQVRRYQCDCT